MASWDIVIPEIFCPFPTTFSDAPHPAAERVGRDVLAHLPASRASSGLDRTVAAVRLVDFTGRFYPGSSPQGLFITMMYSLIFFSHEEWVESGDIQHHPRPGEEAARVYDRALMAFDDATQSTVDDPPFLKMLQPFGQSMRAFGRPDVTSRFRAALRCFLQAQAWELNLLRRGEVPALAVYRDLRRHASGILPAYSLTPLIFDMHTDDHLLDHVLIRTLIARLANYASWANDLLSLSVVP
ncbi:terpene synthase family protein [Streptomyces vinaceus]|uniref:terpene synthase family protein n=1 Tax=Streptomyces vinaceus TaxID=1960 RepID=UPI0036B29E09